MANNCDNDESNCLTSVKLRDDRVIMPLDEKKLIFELR